MSNIPTTLAILNVILSHYLDGVTPRLEDTVATILLNIVHIPEWAAELPDHVKQPERKSFIKDNLEVFGEFLQTFHAQNRTWDDFRALKCLQKIAYSPVLEESDIQPRRRVFVAAWKAPYRGNHVEVFVQSLSDWEQNRVQTAYLGGSEMAYINSISIIQSSGTGKSRMIYETSKSLFLIPMNTRVPNSGGYPPSDELLFKFFSQRNSNFGSACIRYLCFLRFLFEDVTERITLLLANDDYEQKKSRLPELWQTWLETDLPQPQTTQRDAFYESVMQKTNAAIPAHSPKLGDNPNNKMLNLSTDVANALQTLLELLPTSSEYPTLLLCCDEADTTQVQIENDPKRRTNYFAFTYVIDLFKDESFLAIFLSTSSNLTQLAPPSKIHPSERVTDNDSIPPPFCETPFDITKTRISKKLAETLTVAHLARFGRPLWWTTYENGGYTMRDGLIDFALLKLRKARNLGELGLDAHLAHLAAISIRVLFDFESFQSATELEMSLVSSHMRVVWSISEDREQVRSGYPCEPILAVAAYYHMREVIDASAREGSGNDAILEQMETAFVRHWIGRGERGEVLVRFLLTRCFDVGVRLSRKLELPALGTHRRPVPSISVENFMSALLPENHFKQFWRGIPDNFGKNTDQAVPASRAFRQASIHFTHFVRMQPLNPSTFDLWIAMARGQALQCAPNQPDYDIIIPIVFESERPLSRENMSAILIQVKNRGRSVNALEVLPSEENIEGLKNPYISLGLEIGIDQPQIVFPKPIERQNHPPKAQPRYSVRIQGCSKSIFAMIKVSEEKSYRKMIHAGDIFKEHPRQHPLNLAAVARMKPVWGHTEFRNEIYGWVQASESADVEMS